MAPELDIPFGDVPDVVVPVAPGKYHCTITKVPEVQPTKKGDGTKLVVEMRVNDDGEFHGRMLFDNISMKMQTRIKRLCLSAGVRPEAGFSTEDLLDQDVEVLVKSRSYTDPDGETVETTNVVDYVPREGI